MNQSKKHKIALGTATIFSAALLAINVKADTTATSGADTSTATSQTISGTNATDTTVSQTNPSTDNSTAQSDEATPSTETGSETGSSTPSVSNNASSTSTTTVSKPKPTTPVKPKPVITTKKVLLPKSTAVQASASTTTTIQPSVPASTVVQVTPTAPAAPVVSANDATVAANDGKVVYAGPTLKKITAVSTLEKIDNTSPANFIKSIAPSVQIVAGKNNLYASIIIAQAILESGYGQSKICTTDFNIFNITGAYLGNSVSFQTLECDASGTPYYTTQSFRVYSNYNQSLNDYINLMIKGTTWNKDIYAGAWKTNAKTYQDAAQALQGVFATDPTYAQKLISIIQQYHLEQYDNVDASTEVVGDKIPASPVLSARDTDLQFPAYNGVEYPGSSSYAFGNCTQYVYNRIMQLGGYVGQQMGNGGEWGINGAKQGYFTTSVPTVGYAVSFPPGVAGSSPIYGHVAFVEKVYSDGSILVSEMNVKGLNVVSYRHISAGVAALATYIQPK